MQGKNNAELRNRIADLEKRLMESELNNIWKIYARSSVPTILLDETGRIIKWNASLSLLTGFNHGEIPDLNVLIEKIAPDDEAREDLKTSKNKVLNGEIEFIQNERFIKRKDGELRCVEVSAFEIILENEAQILHAVQAIDITERKSAENLLRESEEKYRELFELESDAIFMIRNRDGQILEVNSAALKIYGYTREEILARHNYDLSVEPEETTKATKSGLTVVPVRYHRKKNGIVFPVEITASHSTYKGESIHIAAIRDISELRKHQQIIEQQRSFLKRIIDINPNFIYVYDSNHKFVLANEATANLFGMSADDIVGKTILDISSDKFLGNAMHADNIAILQGNVECIAREEEYIKKDGEKGWAYSVKLPMKNDNDEIEYLIGVSTDITAIKESEEQLLQYKLALESSKDLIVIVNPHYRILVANEAFLKYQNKFRDETINREMESVIGTDDFMNTFKPRIDMALAGKTVNFKTTRTYDGIGERHLDISYYPLHQTIKQINGVVMVMRDITDQVLSEEERKRLQEQLFQAQKMQSIGRLAGGIAHDFNNILAAIMGWTEMIKLKTQNTDHDLSGACNAILIGSERAADLTQKLLGFARGGKYVPVPLNINDIIRDTITVLEKIFDKKIEVVLELYDDIHIIEADKSQMSQVFTNLLINAKDAMPSGGTLTVRTENAFIGDAAFSEETELISGKYLKVIVADSGIGMTAEVKRQIFEPFFTTKPKGQGTGLGLATVYGIIRNHFGHIHVNSVPGKGSEFIIYFPSSDKELITMKAEEKLIYGDNTVLIVDDEKEIRLILKSQLETLGYKVLSAADGLEAVDVYKKNKDTVHLVLLDMIMPRMAGSETYMELKKINPKVKVYLMSGFSQDKNAEGLLSLGATGFLQKPFRIQQLSKILADIKEYQ